MEQNGNGSEALRKRAMEIIERRGRENAVMPFGKHKGLPIQRMIEIDPGYAIWLLMLPNLDSYLKTTIEMFLREARSGDDSTA